MKISIDPNRALPIYQQIVEQLADDIGQGVLPTGAKLPTVRALAEKNALSVGTVRQAYDVLVRRGLLVKHQGRGTFVRPLSPGRLQTPTSPTTVAGVQSRKQRALESIDRALGEILALGLTPQEARIFFDLRLRELEDMGPVTKIGVIDCSPEALSQINEQIAPLPNVESYRYLLDDVIRNPGLVDPELDLIVITTTHIAQLTDRLDPSIPLAAVAMSLSPDTSAKLARVPRGSGVGIVCGSQRFSNIMLRAVTRYCRINEEPRVFHWGEGADKLSRILLGLDAVVLPASYEEVCPPEELDALKAGIEGKRVIFYHFDMDQGSMLSLRNQIQQTLHARVEG